MDKENSNFGSPSKHDSDISLYGNSSPGSTSKCSMICSPSLKSRQPLGEYDINSQDSGYGVSFSEKENSFCAFSASGRGSPRKKCIGSLFGSFASDQSMDDGFVEQLSWKADGAIDDENELPCNFNALLSGSIKSQGIGALSRHQESRSVLRRCISLKEESLTFSITRVKDVELYENRAFKRPEPPAENISPVNSKRYKCTEVQTTRSSLKVQRSISATEESIMSAVQRCKYSTIDYDSVKVVLDFGLK